MGPVLLIDKSALQGLSKSEVHLLYRYYYVAIPHVLLIEILADLSRPPSTRATLSTDAVSIIADKVQSIDSQLIARQIQLCRGELHGYPLRETRRIPIDRAQYFTLPNGERVMFLDEPKEIAILRRWQAGQFQREDHVFAAAWRWVSERLNPSIQFDRLVRDHIILPRCRSLSEVRGGVDHLLSEPGLQLPILRFVCDEFGMPARERRLIERAVKQGGIWIRRVAPYTHYCARVLLSFVAVSRFRLLGGKPTDRVDLEYLFYLPFCHVFASSDRFQLKLASQLMDGDQSLLRGGDLKKDLGRISGYVDRLRPAQKKSLHQERGHYPPDLEGSPTLAMWEKHIGAFSRPRRLPKLSKRQVEELKQRVKWVQEAADRSHKAKE